MNDRKQWVDVFDILWKSLALFFLETLYSGPEVHFLVNLSMDRMVRFRIEDMACGDSGSRVASGESSPFAVTL